MGSHGSAGPVSRVLRPAGVPHAASPRGGVGIIVIHPDGMFPHRDHHRAACGSVPAPRETHPVPLPGGRGSDGASAIMPDSLRAPPAEKRVAPVPGPWFRRKDVGGTPTVWTFATRDQHTTSAHWRNRRWTARLTHPPRGRRNRGLSCRAFGRRTHVFGVCHRARRARRFCRQGRRTFDA